MEGNRKGTFVFHVCVKCHIILNSFIQLTLLGTFLSLFWEARVMYHEIQAQTYFEI